MASPMIQLMLVNVRTVQPMEIFFDARIGHVTTHVTNNRFQRVVSG
jgi:hypothetical protein